MADEERAAPARRRRRAAEAEPQRRSSNGDRPERPRRESSRQKDSIRVSAAGAARSAAEQVLALTGRDPESVVSIERTENGWRVGVEVVEARRIPDSADILAIYEAELDTGGELVSYRRTRRYPRGQTQEDT